MEKSEIARYYDYTLPFYRYFWHIGSESNAIHLGFWEKGTKNLKEALLNTNKFLAEKVKIKSGDIVLDAGCGIGGSSIWLAKNFRTNVIGVTLSERQLKKAKELATMNNVNDLTKFYVRDFLNTKFPKESFDVVWSIESVCHAEKKKDFLKEAFRLLKRGGKIIVSDGFMERNTLNNEEREMVKNVIDGLAVPNFDKLDRFKKSLEEVGFKNIKCWDKTQEVLPSAKRAHNMCELTYPIAKITEKLRITPNILTKNNLAGILLYDMMKMGLASYGVFYAEKIF